MRRINIWAALITGLPLAILTAWREANPLEGSWVQCGLTLLLCALLLGLPAGALAAVPMLRRQRWRLVMLLLPAMVMTAAASALIAPVATLRLVPTGRWVPLPPPPGRPAVLIGPTCDHNFGPARVYVKTEGGQSFLLGGNSTEAWTAVDKVPARGCAALGPSKTPPVPGGEVSRLVFQQSFADCFREFQFALGADGSIWQWGRSGCNDEVVRSLFLYPSLSVVFSLAAWVAVVLGRARGQDPTSA